MCVISGGALQVHLCVRLLRGTRRVESALVRGDHRSLLLSSTVWSALVPLQCLHDRGGRLTQPSQECAEASVRADRGKKSTYSSAPGGANTLSFRPAELTELLGSCRPSLRHDGGELTAGGRGPFCPWLGNAPHPSNSHSHPYRPAKSGMQNTGEVLESGTGENKIIESLFFFSSLMVSAALV